ncbi:hypothetical protein UFOVP341_21 [uncultured Caudovirales phage]|uniref:Uncharacterized protein n=1 Tax=uncultured Caudovirales phage TaxID=2100421 RepID=A0A6J5LZV5_9CAUD|nr:hypothetical protein UFOVP341_21 [uncultured Caudovirales phage]
MSTPETNPLDPKVLEAFSYVIVTAVEGGHYTRDDYREWTQYAHADGPDGFFQAAVTVYPNRVGKYDSDEKPDPVRVTADWFARRIVQGVLSKIGERYQILGIPKTGPEIPAALFDKATRLILGDEDVAGEIDVVDAGALLQVAVYGEVIYG